jgi:hypothetical protein
MPMSQMEIPADWQLKQDPNNGAWTMSGPDVKVHNTGTAMFSYSQDPGTNQMSQYRGVRVRAWLSADQALQQDIKPMMQRDGYSFVSAENAPQVAQGDQRGVDPLYAATPVQRQCQANASEWTMSSGNKLLVVLHHLTFAGQGSVDWGYHCTVLEASPTKFASAKAALLNAFASVRYNQQYFAAYNAKEQGMAASSWSAHNTKMRNNQAAFDQSQATFRANSEATNKAIMGAYNTQNGSNERMHGKEIDVIRGERNGVDPYTGEAFKVEGYEQNVWINQNGVYYGTESYDDPNIGNTGSDVWQQVEVEP